MVEFACNTAVRALILDDGEYTVELESGRPECEAAALLHHRCYEGVTTPDGQECIGRVERGAGALWEETVQSAMTSKPASARGC